MREGAVSEAPRSEGDPGEMLLERAREVYRASRQKSADTTPHLEQRFAEVGRSAKLYFGFHIPPWPPKMLARKVVRRLLMPVLNPQVIFNEAVRDVLLLLRQRADRQAAVQEDAQRQIERLELQVEALTARVEELSRLLAQQGTPAPLPRTVAVEPNGVEAAHAG